MTDEEKYKKCYFITSRGAWKTQFIRYEVENQLKQNKKVKVITRDGIVDGKVWLENDK